MDNYKLKNLISHLLPCTDMSQHMKFKATHYWSNVAENRSSFGFFFISPVCNLVEF